MKIKTKLIISFCMIIFIPMLLALVALFGFQNIQMRAIERNSGIEGAGAYSLNNSVQLLKELTEEEFNELQLLAKESPQIFNNTSELTRINLTLKDKYSYLLLISEKEVEYNGGVDNEKLIEDLRDFNSDKEEIKSYLINSKGVLVKQIDFVGENDLKMSAFIVTSTEHLVPEVRKLLFDIVVAVVMILLMTACVLIAWIYRSMITPIKKLQVAAENIKEGNLDFEIEVAGEDEISELCETFEKMRARLKANAEEKLNDEKENRALISNIAHDLKTPITAVKGYSEGILDGVANTPEKVDKYVRTIYNKANEMDTLINELTIYSKIDTNRIPYNFAKLDVSSYFEDCIEEIGLDLESKGIGIGYCNYVESDTLIIADPEQLRRVIGNIVGNSCKYMNKQNGIINIRVSDVGDFIQVEIEDNGQGIAQKDLPYIFDRFYRADASRNSATGGSGIGLSIVKKIIEDHGGKIWATSKENTGTTMCFVIRKYQEVPNEQDINS